MAEVIITPETGGYDISVYVDTAKIKTTWKPDRQSAYNQARIFADYYKDDNGQSSNIVKTF